METNYTPQILNAKTISQLKEISKSLNLSIGGNKNILIDRILNQQKSTFKQSNYISSLPTDIQKQTLYSLPYPDVEKICNRLGICDDKFWKDYIKNQYFINPIDDRMKYKDIAEDAHEILTRLWKKNIYPSWRVLPFIFEVWLPTKGNLPWKDIDELNADVILTFIHFVPDNTIDSLKDFPSSEKFWGKEIAKIPKAFKSDKDKVDYILKECEIPTAYWTPTGLQDLNFDIDIYNILHYFIDFDDDKDKESLTGHFRILIFKKFGFL